VVEQRFCKFQVTRSSRVGSVILFDSRTKHRVKKIRRGVRKSIVGWVVGPRWR
jgi:predicted 2-oxoglutarate/Fe(II)-dependent dioxygenase YbiX